MRLPVLRPVFAAVGIVAAAGILAGGLALRPAFAHGGPAQVGPLAVVHCVSNSPCETYSNQGHSVGLEGVNSNSSFDGAGLEGNATGNATGVEGFGTNNNGVTGSSTSNAGINGETSTGWAVYGYTFDGIGVYGQSVDNNGGVFESNGTTALVAAGYGGYGIQSIAETDSAAIDALGIDDAIDATSGNSGGYVEVTDNQAYQAGDGILNYAYYAADVDDSNTYPWLARNGSGDDEDWTDSSGNLYYAGSLIFASKTRNGNVVLGYTPRSASPTVEDNGTAHMTNGMAIVQLDKTFADTIDMSRAYQVMLTPDGDTKGLYIASKSPSQFVVREVQGGHSTIDFDYHIYASQSGTAGVRMAEMTAAQAKALQPHAPMAKLTAKRPKIHNKAGVVQL
jgi:hypothetical protein